MTTIKTRIQAAWATLLGRKPSGPYSTHRPPNPTEIGWFFDRMRRERDEDSTQAVLYVSRYPGGNYYEDMAYGVQLGAKLRDLDVEVVEVETSEGGTVRLRFGTNAEAIMYKLANSEDVVDAPWKVFLEGGHP